MQNEAVGLITADNKVAGVRVQTPEGQADIQADLVIGCDGRHSITRQAGQLEVIELGVPIDVLWFRISRHTSDPEQLLGNINYGRALVLIDRGDYFQAGLIIRKGSFEEIKAGGLESFRDIVGCIAPYLGRSTGRVKRLGADQASIRADQPPAAMVSARAAVHRRCGARHVASRRRRNQPRNSGCRRGCQPAHRCHCAKVASPNQLSPSCSSGVSFQQSVTQQMQVFAHGLFQRVFQNTGPAKAPWQLKTVFHIPGMQRVDGRMVGMGVRPEHIKGAKKSRTGAKPASEASPSVSGLRRRC